MEWNTNHGLDTWIDKTRSTTVPQTTDKLGWNILSLKMTLSSAPERSPSCWTLLGTLCFSFSHISKNVATSPHVPHYVPHLLTDLISIVSWLLGVLRSAKLVVFIFLNWWTPALCFWGFCFPNIISSLQSSASCCTSVPHCVLMG